MNFDLLFFTTLLAIPEYIPYTLLGLALIAIVILVIILLNYRRHLHKELARSRKTDEIKSSFLTHINKALRMPLAIINSNCHDLRGAENKTMTEEERDKMLREIHENSHQMFTYLNELQELTNFDGAIPAISTIEVNLAELILSYRREILHETRRGVMVGIRTAMSPHCKATLDTTMFRQLIMNLLRIAAKRTKEGSITIRYDWENEGLRFWIEDSGGAVPEEIRGILFTNLLDSDDIKKIEDRSIYITLSICKAIVDSLQGTIEALPSEDDKGALVSFWIPCYVKFD